MSAKLLNTYIINGQYFPNAGQQILPGSLELVTNSFFAVRGKQDHTLLGTDEKGILRSVQGDMTFAPQPKQHPPRQPLSLYVIPTGPVRACFFANAQGWQTEIINEFNGMTSDAQCGLVPMKTTPVTFEKRHLKPPEDEDAKAEFDKAFEDGETYNGQLIRKVQCVAILVSESAFSEKEAEKRKKSQRKESLAYLETDTAEQIPLVEIKSDNPVEFQSAFNDQTIRGKFRIFAVTSLDKPIPEGQYRFKLNPAGLGGRLYSWCQNNGAQFIKFSIDIKFNITGLAGDYDFHVMNPITLEESLIGQFPEKFATVKQSLLSAETNTQDSSLKETQDAFKTWVLRYTDTAEKVKYATSYIEARPNQRPAKIGADVLGFMVKYTEENAPDKTEDMKLILDNFKAYTSRKEVIDKWKALINKQIPKLRTVLDGVGSDGKWISKRFVSTSLSNYVWQTAKYKNKMLRRIGALDIARFKTDPGYAARAKRLILLDGMAAKDVTVAKAFAKIAGKALSVMDTVVSLQNMAALINGRNDAKAKKELYNKRFSEGIKVYHRKFGTYPSLIGMSRLEALRKLSDTAAVELSDKDRELLYSAIDTALNLAVYVPVPVIQEIAGLILLGKAVVNLSGAVLSQIGADLDRCLLDCMLQDFIDRNNRLDILEKEYVQNIKFIKNYKGKPEDPEVQFRIRAIVLAGLMRLIERCGSRYDKENDTVKFEDKIKQYNIMGYIDAFIFNSPKKPAYISLITEIPLDELWLFCKGNKADWGIVAASRTYKIIKDNWYALPLVAIGTMPATAAGIPVITASKTPVLFQKQFPIHWLDSETIPQFARSLCTNYSGIKADDFEFTRVYAKKADGKWETVESYEKNPANPPIDPYTEIRVVIVLKGENLTGLPLSLQLCRYFILYSAEGPIYKGMALRLEASENNEGLDKGLLTDTDEKYYLSTPDKPRYGFVFHPFYYFGNAIVKGTKPCAFISMEKDPAIHMKFKIGAGDKPIYDVHTGPSKKTTYDLTLTLGNPQFTAMLLDRTFLENKTAQPTAYPVFDRYLELITLCGVFVKRGTAWDYIPLYKNSLLNVLPSVFIPNTTLTAGKQFDFAWDRPFEIIFLFSSLCMTQKWMEAPELRFPAMATVREKSEGPSYPTEIVCLDKVTSFTKYSPPTHLKLGGLLREKKIVKGNEFVHNFESKDNIESMLPNAQGNFLFAARIGFAYIVGSDDGTKKIYNRFKPFGSRYVTEGSVPYTYNVKLSSPAYGLKELNGPKLDLPGLPDPSRFGFPINENFVTSDKLRPLLDIERSDYN